MFAKKSSLMDVCQVLRYTLDIFRYSDGNLFIQSWHCDIYSSVYILLIVSYSYSFNDRRVSVITKCIIGFPRIKNMMVLMRWKSYIATTNPEYNSNLKLVSPLYLLQHANRPNAAYDTGIPTVFFGATVPICSVYLSGTKWFTPWW